MENCYKNPLITRYASSEMSELFSCTKKFSTWRRCWLALATAQKELGLSITDEQLAEMEKHLDVLNLDEAQKKEKEIRHDVLAHIYAFGLQCPSAKPIIHLGATSCFVTDNTDMILQREALQLVRDNLLTVVANLAQFAREYKSTPTLGFTHFQSAQLVTVGKRATLWIADFLDDIRAIDMHIQRMRLRGVKGTTGTQASFLKLFDGDSDKVKQLDQKVVEKLGFSDSLPVTGQTYSRKYDTQLLTLLANIGESAHKFSNDIRLLQHLKEVEEPFAKKQKGSSAMAYKRNPMRSERIGSLSRYLILSPQNMGMTSATQWLERTLDDSALRRIILPQAFLAADAVLQLCCNVSNGLVVHEKMIAKHVAEELPFMATENIIMHCVEKGGDRQELHTLIRDHSMEAAKAVKEGGVNDLLDRIANDSAMNVSRAEIDALLDVTKFIGRAPEQVDEFLAEHVEPVIKGHIATESELRV